MNSTSEDHELTEKDAPVRVLIADDDQHVLATVLSALGGVGYECVTACDGEAALAALRADDFTVALVDLEMPKLDGFGVLAALQQDGLEVSPVVLTGGASIEGTVRAMKLGAYEFIEKPANAALIRAVVERATAHRRLRDSAKELAGIAERHAAELARTNEILRLDEARLETLWKLSQMGEESFQEIADFALDEGVRLTGSTMGYLAFMNDDETVLTMYAWTKTAMEQCAMTDKPIEYPVDETGLWGEAVRQRKPIITNDYEAPNPLKRGTPEGHVPILRHMNVPVFDDGRVVLVAGVGNKEEPYDATDVRQLVLLMAGMWRIVRQKRAVEALALERQSLELKVEERTRELSALNEILRLSLTNQPLRDVLEKALDLVTAASDLTAERQGSVFLVEGKTQTLVLSAQRGVLPPLLAACTRVPFGACLCGRAAATGAVQFADCINACHDIRCDGMPPHGHCCVPMQIDGRTVGVLNLYVQEGQPRDEKREQFLLTLANALAGIVARREMESALRSSEERYRLILRTAMSGFWLTDSQGRLLEVNEAYCRMSGYSEQELLAMSVSDLEAFETPANIAAHAFGIRERGEDRFESRHRRKDGSTFDVEVSVKYQPSEGGLFVAFLQDITVEKQAAESLRQSEQRFLDVLYASSDAILLIDRETFVDCNEATARMLGYSSRGQFLMTHPSELSPATQPDGRGSFEKANEMMQMAFERGFHRFEWIHRKANGEEFPVEVSLTPINYQGRTVLHCLWRDITEQKLTVEKSRASEEKFRQIVDNIGLGVALISPDMRVLELNRQMRAWFPNIALETRPVCHLSFNEPPSDTPCPHCPTIETFRDGKVHEATVVSLQAGGNRNYRIITSPIHDHEGRVAAVIEMVEDMTGKLRLERELHQAQKLEAVGRLAAGIAHEINTPTQYVGDNIEFLQGAYESLVALVKIVPAMIQAGREAAVSDGLFSEAEDLIDAVSLDYLTEQVPRAIEQSLEGVGRIATIVQAMKEFSHPGSVEKSAVDLNQCIRSTATVSRNEWKYVADLVLELDSLLPLVVCLPGELNQVILNIIVNAAHAIADVVGQDGSAGKGRITIETHQDGDWCEIRIADTGAGIPEAIRERVFDPFFTTKEVGRGTGQGLAVARNVIVDKHGGTITFETKVGAGTVFIIRLPVSA